MMKKTMEDYIAQTAQTLENNVNRRTEILHPLLTWIKENGLKDAPVVIVASGSSYNAAVCAQPFMKKYISSGVKAVWPFSFMHYEKTDSNALYLFVSQSGSSTNMIEALKTAQEKGLKTVAIVGKEGTKLSENADITILYGVGEESVGYVTKGMSTLTLFFMLMALELNREMIAKNEYDEALEELRKAGRGHGLVYQSAKVFCEENEEALLRMEHAFFLGCGANMGTIQEGALKVSEMVHIQTNDYEIEEFIHGPNLQLTPEYTLFFVDGGDAAGEHVRKIWDAAKVICENSYLISAKSTGSAEGWEMVSPIYLTAFFQYLAFFVSKMRNITSEHPLLEKFEERIPSKTDDYEEETPF